MLDHGLSLLVERCRELLISLYATRKHFLNTGVGRDRPRVGLPSQCLVEQRSVQFLVESEAATPCPDTLSL
jgi:hypothetical protein